VKFGLLIPLAAPYGTSRFVEKLGRLAEDHGFDSLWLGEHVVVPSQWESSYPLDEAGRMPSAVQLGELDPYTTLAYLAAITKHIRLGACTVVPQKNPVYTAKQIANADWLSGGRIDFGAGIGWAKEEFEALGAPFEKRGARCTSYLRVIKRLWTEPEAAYEDEFYSLRSSLLYPKPLQKPHPPIHILGQSGAPIKRVAELGDGFFPLDQSPEQMAVIIRELDAELQKRGRKLPDITITASPYTSGCDLAKVEAYRRAGVDQVVLFQFVEDIAELEPVIEGFARNIVRPGRAI
jgi:probable F420-dependent oxidoreductase